MRRFTNAIDIEVVPLPAEAANLPIGKFALDCRSAAASWWPKVTVDVVGSGNASSTAWPRFIKPPNIPIVISGGKLREEQQTNHYEWTYEVHSRDPQLVVMPDLVFDYYDPETHRTERASCAEPPLLARTEEPMSTATSTRPAKRSGAGPEMRIAQYVSGLCALAGVIVVFTAMRR